MENFPRASPKSSTQKSIQDRSRESLRGIQNRVKIDPGILSGRPVAPKSVLGVTRGRLGSVTGGPGSSGRVPKMSLWKQGILLGCPGAPGSAPRQLKSTPIRHRERKIPVFFARLVRAGLSERFFDNFHRFSAFLKNVKSLFRTTPASKNRGSALRAASRVARAM